MQILKQEITEFISSTISDDYPEWDVGTTYSLELDDENLTSASVVKYGNYYYRSLTADNVGFIPSEYLNVKWVKWGISNKYAMLDSASGSQSRIDGGDLIVEFLREDIETLVFGKTTGRILTIEQYDKLDVLIPEVTVVTGTSINDDVEDYWTYMYSEYEVAKEQAIKVDIPPAGYKVKVTLTGETGLGYASCGFLVGGQPISMGDTLYGVNFSFNSYATKEVDAFGTLSITKRRVQDLVDFETEIPSGELQSLKRKLKDIYNEIVVFILDESDSQRYENLITLGTVENASVVLPNETLSVMTWSVMESI